MTYNLFWNYKKINKRPVWLKILLPILLVLGLSYFQLVFSPQNAIIGPYVFFIAVLMFSGCYGGTTSMLSASIVISCLIFVTPYFITKQSNPTNNLFSALFVIEAFVATGLVWTIQQAFKKFRQKELKFKKMVEQTEEAFAIVDEKLNLTYYTPAFQSILRYTNEELKTTKFHELLHPSDRKKFEFDFLKLIAHKAGVKQWKGRLRTSDTDIWVEINVADLLSDDSVNGFIIHFNNIDRQIKDDIQKEDFVHMATHELKSPVTVLKGYLQILLNRFRKEAGNEKHLQMLEKMDLQLNKLLTLISDMLDTTKIKSGELNHHFALFDINHCIRTCVDGVKVANCDCEITYNLDESIPSVTGDKDRIHQVVNNFLTNALKYSPDNKKIEITTTKEERHFRVSVKDHGIGIPKEKVSQVFERFYRVDTLPKGVYEGLGLGLFICSEIIKKHNGQIGVNSEEGKGSEFWFTLPISG